MELKLQLRLARDYGFNLGAEYHGTNGARVIPLEIWENAFDGALMVAYNAADKGQHNFARGDTSPSSMHHWLFG